jgi:hypothetical protein
MNVSSAYLKCPTIWHLINSLLFGYVLDAVTKLKQLLQARALPLQVLSLFTVSVIKLRVILF